jgi:hypothetical protein
LYTEEELKISQRHENTGLPRGRYSFAARLEKTLGKILRPRNPNPQKKMLWQVLWVKANGQWQKYPNFEPCKDVRKIISKID